MKTNEYFSKSVSGSQQDFIEFVKINTYDSEDANDNEIDFLIQKIAQNLFYFDDNIRTAKSDYIYLIGLLIKKGVIFNKDQKTETNEATKNNPA